jgi:hypothetical protein
MWERAIVACIEEFIRWGFGMKRKIAVRIKFNDKNIAKYLKNIHLCDNGEEFESDVMTFYKIIKGRSICNFVKTFDTNKIR